MNCPKCGASKSHLYVERDYSHYGGGAVEMLRCRNCGYCKLLPEKVQCVPHAGSAALHVRKVPVSVQGWRSCQVCGRSIGKENTTGLCIGCYGKNYHWEHSKRTKPAPIIRVAGRWMANPGRANK